MSWGLYKSVGGVSGWEPHHNTGAVLQADCTETHAAVEATRHEESDGKLGVTIM